jgi:transitional endoplasmic reticulum ATPase
MCREAATIAVRESVQSQSGDEPTAVEEIVLTQAHFEAALDEVGPEDAGLRSGVDEL